jgi:hypothetical protein
MKLAVVPGSIEQFSNPLALFCLVIVKIMIETATHLTSFMDVQAKKYYFNGLSLTDELYMLFNIQC